MQYNRVPAILHLVLFLPVQPMFTTNCHTDYHIDIILIAILVAVCTVVIFHMIIPLVTITIDTMSILLKLLVIRVTVNSTC